MRFLSDVSLLAARHPTDPARVQFAAPGDKFVSGVASHHDGECRDRVVRCNEGPNGPGMSDGPLLCVYGVDLGPPARSTELGLLWYAVTGREDLCVQRVLDHALETAAQVQPQVDVLLALRLQTPDSQPGHRPAYP
jgi:hypothetical protein